MKLARTALVLVAAASAGLAYPTGGWAQEENAWTFSDQAELSFVLTAGNAASNTLGFKNTFTGTRARSKFRIQGGGIRTESTTRIRRALGTATSFSIEETEVDELTAESYFAKGRYEHTVSTKAIVFGGAAWDRNTFSGIDSRVTFVAGAGVKWVDREDFTFVTDAGATYTIQNNVAEGPTDEFGGVQFSWDLTKQVTESTGFESKLVIDQNVEESEDLRADFTNSLSVSMSQVLALKTSLQILFDNSPSFEDVPLITGGVDTGTTVPVELDEVDSVFTVALVVNF